jgi:hypothetical protein
VEVEALASYLLSKYKQISETKERLAEELYFRKEAATGLTGAKARGTVINDNEYRAYYHDNVASQNVYALFVDLHRISFNRRNTLQERSYNFRREQKADENSR